MNNHQTVQIPCKYCDAKLEISRYAFEELHKTFDICGACRTKIKNAQECDVCHIKLFKGCDHCNTPEEYRKGNYYKEGDKLYHMITSSDGVSEEHLCEQHRTEFIKILHAFYGVEEDD